MRREKSDLDYVLESTVAKSFLMQNFWSDQKRPAMTPTNITTSWGACQRMHTLLTEAKTAVDGVRWNKSEMLFLKGMTITTYLNTIIINL